MTRGITKQKSLFAGYKYAVLLCMTAKLLIADWIKSKAYRYCLVNFAHSVVVEAAHFFFKPLFVNSTYLLQKYNGVFSQTARNCIYSYVGGHTRLILTACNCGGYDRRAVTVADIVLNDKNRSYAALF